MDTPSVLLTFGATVSSLTWTCLCAMDQVNHKSLQQVVQPFLTKITAKGFVDGNYGCAAIRRMVERVRPRLFVCGHIHSAHGVAEGPNGTTFVNAAIVRNGYTAGWEAVEVEI